MKKLLTFLFILILFSGYSQKNIQSIILSDSGYNLNKSYLKQLDSIFAKKRLIGIGESTHGTSEFTIIRADLFKYLVKKHNYSVFFLEADYNACSRINRYIHGANDNSKDALFEVQLWPWLTQEFLDLIEWMRLYNLQHHNVIEFIGCDMQLITDDEKEFKRYLAHNPKFTKFEYAIPSLDFDIKDSSLISTKQKEWLKFSKTFLKTFPNENPLLVETINQWFEKATNLGFNDNFRDSCMGNNIVDYLMLNSLKKGIYFAHNEHVGKMESPQTKNNIIYRRAGSFINERLKNDYYSIALDFYKGQFNAINFVNDEYRMEIFSIKKSKSISKYLSKDINHVKFISRDNLSKRKKIKINSIGAVYGRSKNGNKIYRYRNVNKKDYDAFIIIKEGTPTNLLNIEITKKG